MKTKVTGYLTQKHGFYYVVLNLPTDEKGKRNRKTLSTGLSTDRNATKAKALLLTMIREANAGEEVRGVNERQPKSQNKTEDERWNLRGRYGSSCDPGLCDTGFPRNALEEWFPPDSLP